MAARDFAILRSPAELEALVPDWTSLFYEAATSNPFAHPDWLVTWARHWVPPGALYVVTARENGRLVGVAPFYRHRFGPAFGPGVTRLQLFGNAAADRLTELPQILVHPEKARHVLGELMDFLARRASEWDWLEVILTPEQGWPHWVGELGRGCLVVHKTTRRSVVLPLPPTWEELRGSLKRNVKESIRRGTNRLAREGLGWELVDSFADQADYERALDELVRLHRARARMAGTVPHEDYLDDGTSLGFLRDAGRRLFASGHLVPCLLRVNGTVVAARLVLEANGTVFFSISGFDPEWWRFNTATTLAAELLRRAIERGAALANLSMGPDVSKLRWSEQLERHEEFAIVGPRRRSRASFWIYWELRAASLIAHAESAQAARPGPARQQDEDELPADESSVLTHGPVRLLGSDGG